MKLDITHYVDCTTGHITKEDSEALDKQAAMTRDENGAVPDLVTYSYLYGYFVPIPDGIMNPGMVDTLFVAGFSQAFVQLLQHCHESDARMLRLDRDGDEHEGLPKFDW